MALLEISRASSLVVVVFMAAACASEVVTAGAPGSTGGAGGAGGVGTTGSTSGTTTTSADDCAGLPAPEVIRDSGCYQRVALNEGHLYWVEVPPGGDGASAGVIKSAGVAGGPETVLYAEPGRAIVDILPIGDTLYWSEMPAPSGSSTVNSMPTAGGSPSWIFTGPKAFLAANSTHLFISADKAYRKPLVGGFVETIYEDATNKLHVTDSTAYAVGPDSQMFQFPVYGGPKGLTWIGDVLSYIIAAPYFVVQTYGDDILSYPYECSSPVGLATGSALRLGPSDGVYVYWMDGRRVRRAPVGGGAASTVACVDSLADPDSGGIFAVDDESLYVLQVCRGGAQTGATLRVAIPPTP